MLGIPAWDSSVRVGQGPWELWLFSTTVLAPHNLNDLIYVDESLLENLEKAFSRIFSVISDGGKRLWISPHWQ